MSADVIKLSATPTNTAALYASGNVLGTLMEFDLPAMRAGGIIRSFVLTDKGNQKANTDVLFFDTNPTNSTFTDKAAVTFNALDLPFVCGTVSITSWEAFAANAVAAQRDLQIAFHGSKFYALLVTRGTPTPTSTTDYSLNVQVELAKH